MPSTIPEQTTDKIDFDGIKSRIDLNTFIGQYTELRASGRAMKGRCPLPSHSDSTPSFNVYPDGKWKCYGCQATGDLFDFAKLMWDMSPRQFVNSL